MFDCSHQRDKSNWGELYYHIGLPVSVEYDLLHTFFFLLTTGSIGNSCEIYIDDNTFRNIIDHIIVLSPFLCTI